MKRVESGTSTAGAISLLEPILDEMRVTQTDLTALVKTDEYMTGDGKLCHVWLWSKPLNAHFILIVDRLSGDLVGYTCQDIKGQYMPCKLSSPYLDADCVADENLITEFLEFIDTKAGDEDAFAVLESGGCYIQTLRESDGFLLEYQTASIAFHFQVSKKLSVTEVTDAFISFEKGDDKWLDGFQWEHLML